jgi:hypothetical protein
VDPNVVDLKLLAGSGKIISDPDPANSRFKMSDKLIKFIFSQQNAQFEKKFPRKLEVIKNLVYKYCKVL